MPIGVGIWRPCEENELKHVNISEDCLENDWYVFRCPYCNDLTNQFMENSAHGIEARGDGARKKCFKCQKYFLVRVRKADPAGHLIQVLDPHKILYTSGPHVASEFKRLRKIVPDSYVKLLAAVMSYWKWEQNNNERHLGVGPGACPHCILQGFNNLAVVDCIKCSLFEVNDHCSGQRTAWRIAACDNGDKAPLLAALKLAVAYEIENHDDYDLEALRKALAGENKSDIGKVKDWVKSFSEEIPEVIVIVVEGSHGADGYYCSQCPYCGNDFLFGKDSFYAEEMRKEKNPVCQCLRLSCNKKFTLRFVNQEIPEVIANEDEDGKYWYTHPFRGSKEIFPLSCHDHDILTCWKTNKPYTVRRRTRYERWAEEETELWCVYKFPASANWDMHNVAIKKNYQDKAGIYLDQQWFAFEDWERPSSTANRVTAYLGESREEAFKIACKKWEENETILWFANAEKTVGGAVRGELTKSYIYPTSTGGSLSGKLFHRGNPESPPSFRCCLDRINDWNHLLTPDFNKAAAWLKEKLTDDDR